MHANISFKILKPQTLKDRVTFHCCFSLYSCSFPRVPWLGQPGLPGSRGSRRWPGGSQGSPRCCTRIVSAVQGALFVQWWVFPFQFSKVMETSVGFWCPVCYHKVGLCWAWLNPSQHPFGNELVQNERLHLSFPQWLTGYLTRKEWHHVSVRKGTVQSVRSGFSLSLQLRAALRDVNGIVTPISQSIMLRYGGC